MQRAAFAVSWTSRSATSGGATRALCDASVTRVSPAGTGPAQWRSRGAPPSASDAQRKTPSAGRPLLPLGGGRVSRYLGKWRRRAWVPAIGAVVALRRRGARQARRCQVGVWRRLHAILGCDVRLSPWGILAALCTRRACGRTVARSPRRAREKDKSMHSGLGGGVMRHERACERGWLSNAVTCKPKLHAHAHADWAAGG